MSLLRDRRSRARCQLVTPATRPDRVVKAAALDCDALVIDLEDAVAEADKDSARQHMRELLAQPWVRDRNVGVRINDVRTRWFLDDMLAMEGLPVATVVLPKVQDPADVHALDRLIHQIELRGMRRPTIHILIESALGLERVWEIVTASPQVVGVIFGSADFAADAGTSPDGQGLAYPRARIAAAAAAARIDAFDHVYAAVDDDDGLRREATEGRSMGFTGKWAIHPRQIRIINDAFGPTTDELAEARRIIGSFDGTSAHRGAVKVDGRLIDEATLKIMRRRISASKKTTKSGGDGNMAHLEADPTARSLTSEHIVDIPGLASHWVRLPDGRRAHYVTSGDKGPPVVLLHGGLEGSSGTAGWRFMAPFLGARGFRVYCPDRPGYGLSDVSNKRYLDASPKANVDFLKEFADAMCLDSFHLSGNSAGCMVSCDFVLAHPERVRSIMFIAGHLGDVNTKPLIASKEGKFSSNPAYVSAAWDGTREGMQALMEGIIYKREAISPEFLDMRVYSAQMQRAARREYGVEFNISPFNLPPDMAQVRSSIGRITRLSTPMIYLYGLQDVLRPVENGFNQEDAAPNIQFFYPDECGHQGQTDQPDLFNEMALEFFGRGKLPWSLACKAGVSRRRAINPRYVDEPSTGFPPPRPGIYSDIEILRQGLADGGPE
jgi:citrate lyase beta subunit/pimeloyl-ACP methyl ester carboxylesterase